MTKESILSTINVWASERGLHFTAEDLSTPPPLLLAGVATAGVCLTINSPESEEPRLGIWITEDGGNCVMTSGGDDEMTNSPLPEFKDEKELTAKLNSLLFQFQKDLVFVPALENWLGEKGIAFTSVELQEFSGEAGHQNVNSDDWFFVQFKTPAPQEYDITLGLAGDGRGATFHTNDEGWYDFDDFEDGLHSAKHLRVWLDGQLSAWTNTPSL